MSFTTFAPRVLRRILALGLAAACGRTVGDHLTTSSPPDVPELVSSCKPSDPLVVANKSGYPVTVVAYTPGEPYTGSSLFSAQPLVTVQSGQVETVTIPARRKVRYDIARPPLPSGALQKTDGVRS